MVTLIREIIFLWIVILVAHFSGKRDSIALYKTKLLVLAIRKDNASRIKALIAMGVNVNAKTGDGMTPLMRSGLAGSANAMKALLEARADVNAVSSRGNTALIFAARSGNSNCAKILADGGGWLNCHKRLQLHAAHGVGC